MPALDGNVRDYVVREMRAEIRSMAADGMSKEEIAQGVNGHRTLTDAEVGLIQLLAYHSVAEVEGHY